MPTSFEDVVSPRRGGVARTRPDAVVVPLDPPPTFETELVAQGAELGLPTTRLDLDAQLDDSTPVLWVTAVDDGHFAVEGRHPTYSLARQESPDWTRPGFGLQNLHRDSDGSLMDGADIFDHMSSWSSTKTAIADWINCLRAAGIADLQLVVADVTGFEIAWELLAVDETGEAWESLLGALLPVTRWCRTSDSEGLKSREPDNCSGQIVALIHEGLTSKAEEQAIFWGQPVATHGRLGPFREALRQDIPGVGLIYLACHGIVGHSETEWALEGKTLDGKAERLKLVDLFRVKPQMLRRSGALVFLNACDSARLLPDEIVRDTMLRGFVVRFLKEGARGLIGTLGKVDSPTAVALASRLVAEWAEDNSESVPAQLQHFRASAVAALPAIPSAADFTPFVSAFLYVYYGNPRLRLRITAKPGIPR